MELLILGGSRGGKALRFECAVLATLLRRMLEVRWATIALDSACAIDRARVEKAARFRGD